MKTYGEWYNFWKRFNQVALVEIREVIVADGKSDINSLKISSPSSFNIKLTRCVVDDT